MNDLKPCKCGSENLGEEEVLKDVTITSTTDGEVVAVTLTDEDHKIYKVLWTKEKK